MKKTKFTYLENVQLVGRRERHNLQGNAAVQKSDVTKAVSVLK